jgi:ABC-type nitrate/sulfonate/bicarbonate transport system permease component
MNNARFDWQARAIQVLFVLALGAFWYYVSSTGLVSGVFLPKLPRVWDKVVQVAQSASFYSNLGITLFELFVAFSIASVFGLSIGYLVGRSRYAVVVFEPLLASVFAVPLVVFLPLFILFFGIGVEMIAGLYGLGSRIVNLAEGMNTAEMFAYILFVIVLAMVLNITLTTMQSRFNAARSGT